MSEFQTKQDLLHVEKLLAQEPSVRDTIVEDQVVPGLREEPVLGPTPDIRAEIHHPPDPSALAAWMDDLAEYGDDHRGEEKPSKLLDQIANHALDELVEMARDHLKDQSDAADEQTGLVTNFIADSALEGAGVEVPEKGADEDYIVRAAPAVDPLGFNGGGGGGGGGGAGGWPGSEGIGDEGSNDEGDGDEGKPEEKQEKGRIGKLVDKVLKRDTAEQKPQTKPDPKAPEKPKKPDGDR